MATNPRFHLFYSAELSQVIHFKPNLRILAFVFLSAFQHPHVEATGSWSSDVCHLLRATGAWERGKHSVLSFNPDSFGSHASAGRSFVSAANNEMNVCHQTFCCLPRTADSITSFFSTLKVPDFSVGVFRQPKNFLEVYYVKRMWVTFWLCAATAQVGAEHFMDWMSSERSSLSLHFILVPLWIRIENDWFISLMSLLLVYSPSMEIIRMAVQDNATFPQARLPQLYVRQSCSSRTPSFHCFLQNVAFSVFLP